MKSSCLIFLMAVTLTVSLIETTVSANSNEANDAQIAIRTVSLFKNGLGYFNSTAVLPKNATSVRLGQLPVPAYGTFWIGYPENVDVRRITTGLEEFEDTIPITNLWQLLQENTGRRVVLATGLENQGVIEGKILGFMKPDTRDEPGNPYFMGERTRNNQYRPVVPSGNVILLESARGTVVLDQSTIKRADFPGDGISTSTSIKKKRPSINIEFEKPAGGSEISMSYLAKGITWSPSYHIDLSDPGKARLSAKALVINEVVDLDGVTLELVTGFPNIKFGEVLSPVAMSQTLAEFLQSLVSGNTESRNRRSYMTQQRMLMSNVADYSAPVVPSYSTVTEGMVSEDLFLYPVEDFTLKKGETAYVPLFTAEVPYRHVYTWKIKDFIDEREQYRSDRELADAKTTEEVWHSCRLVNELKMPLTTAAAEFVKDGKFVGQDVCYYTAPGTETTIRINRAMNVIAEQAEFEIERKHNADRFYNHNYDLVKVRGELKLRSRLDKAADVEIAKELSGEIIENSDEATDTKTAKGLKRVNPKHILTWEIKLEPGQEVELTYVYEVYVRN